MVEIVLATNNEHKFNEFKEILNNTNIKLFKLNNLNIISDPNENGKSYKENALIKARSIKDKTNLFILADDTGIEFDALREHFPGIFSARYAKENGGNDILNLKLSKEIGGSNATFFSTLVLITPSKEELIFESFVKGKVSKSIEGTNGFGYDNIFIPENYNHTYAFLDQEIKNKISHRAKSCQKLLNYLKENNLI